MPEKPRFKEGGAAALFLELAQPDDEGFSRIVPVSEFVGKYEKLKFGNGGSWVRKDGALAAHYNIRLKKGGRGNAIVSVELHGYNKNPIDKGIPPHIASVVRKQTCVVLGTSGPEVDHKDGHLDDRRPAEEMKLEDFQPLSKAANGAKREYCKKCRETKRRFDATRLGYAVPQWKGNGDYTGTCVGCYWYDPLRFNQEVSLLFAERQAAVKGGN